MAYNGQAILFVSGRCALFFLLNVEIRHDFLSNLLFFRTRALEQLFEHSLEPFFPNFLTQDVDTLKVKYAKTCYHSKNNINEPQDNLEGSF